MKKRIVAVLLSWLSVCLPLTSCGTGAERYSSHSFEYFDTVTTVTGYAQSREEFDLVCGEIFDLLSDCHRLFTTYERYEGLKNLCAVNESEGGVSRTVAVDARVMDLLLFSKQAYQKTDGKVNIAMGSVLSLWHDYRKRGLEDPLTASLPPMAELRRAALHTDITNLILDEENGTVTLADPEMRLDVGAVAKGYAVEMAARALEEKGITGYVINVGGNVRTVGAKANGEKWVVGIENPEDDGTLPYAAYVYLSGESVVTSGAYQRYYTVDEKNYHHVIDPETLMPAEGYRSVSVICKDSAEGDALSTALFCMALEEGLSLVESLDGVEAMWILADGTKKTSSGFTVYTLK